MNFLNILKVIQYLKNIAKLCWLQMFTNYDTEESIFYFILAAVLPDTWTGKIGDHQIAQKVADLKFLQPKFIISRNTEEVFMTFLDYDKQFSMTYKHSNEAK